MLTPDDFTTPRIAATWTALTTLAGRGEPVDFVLLAAAVQRHGTSRNGAQGMPPAELFRLAQRGDRGLGHRAVQTVARAACAERCPRRRSRSPLRRPTPPWPRDT